MTMGRWLAEKEIAGCSLSVIVAKGKKFGAFKFHLQGSEKRLEQSLADEQSLNH